jgi:TolB-like protein/DNA-binding winged helix-turn-helix (wHTH) protein/cytochrome c-type biogenesis protein CcmH/NrfG
LSGDDEEIRLAREPDFRIGTIEVRPSTREFCIGDERSILEPRVMQVLTLLAAAQGRIVSRDELVSRCWAGRAVSEDAINRAISRVRKLSELDGGQSFQLETVPRVGYGLRRTARSEEPTAAAETSAESIANPGRRRLLILLGASGLVIAGGGAAWMLNSTRARPRIAVLPLDADTASQRVIADGLVDDLISALMTIPELDVVARSSSFALRGRKGDASRLLGAHYLIDGAVRQSGTSGNAVIDLVDAGRQSTLWSQQYPLAFNDLSLLRARVVRDATAVLNLSVSDPDLERRVDEVAYRQFFAGRSLLMQDTPDPTGAITILKQVVERAPNFSRGWSTLSNAYVAVQGPIDEAAHTPFARGAARDAARRALAINGRNAEAVAMLAAATDRTGGWAAIEKLYQHALALETSNVDALYGAGAFYADVGWNDRSIKLLRRAWELDPLNTDAAFLLLRVLEADRRDDEVESLLQEVRHRWTNDRSLWRFATRRTIWERNFREAESLIRQAPADSGSDAHYFTDLLACMRDPNSPRIATFLAPATSGSFSMPWPIAVFSLAMIGKTGPCLDLIKHIFLSAAGRQQAPTWVLLQAMMRPLWREPGLHVVLDQLGLASYWRDRGLDPLSN